MGSVHYLCQGGRGKNIGRVNILCELKLALCVLVSPHGVNIERPLSRADFLSGAPKIDAPIPSRMESTRVNRYFLCNQYFYCDHLIEEIIIREEQNEDERQAQGRIAS